jgi:hypothetical protein
MFLPIQGGGQEGDGNLLSDTKQHRIYEKNLKELDLGG